MKHGVKALPNRWIVDANISRARLVSQWPGLVHDWMYRELGEPGLAATLRTYLRALLTTAVLMVLIVISFAAIFWMTSPIHVLFASEDVHDWCTIVPEYVIWASVIFSVGEGKPFGLFWVAYVCERPLKPNRQD